MSQKKSSRAKELLRTQNRSASKGKKTKTRDLKSLPAKKTKNNGKVSLKGRGAEIDAPESVLKSFLSRQKLNLKIPNEKRVAADFFAFCQTIAVLRHPNFGCPWDLQQDHKTLRPFMLEESYEACHAMSGEKPQEICEELGDVLLQVVLNAQVAHDNEQFTIREVIQGIMRKMIERHPHVFLRPEQESRLSSAQVLANWEQVKIKEQEKTLGKTKIKGYFKQHGIDKVFPATAKAHKIGVLAQKIHFDWTSVLDVWNQLKSEFVELEAEMAVAQSSTMTSQLKHRIQDEIGDLYFTLAQLCRHLNLSPEIVASEANEKFLARFEKIEELIRRDKKTLKQLNSDDLETYWKEAKKSKATARKHLDSR